MIRFKRTNKAEQGHVPPASFAWYYSSNRARTMPVAPAAPGVPPPGKPKSKRKFVVTLLVLIVAALAVSWPMTRTFRTDIMGNAADQQAASRANPCQANTLGQYILVSVSQRHLWACDYSTLVYDSAVVTGMERYAADRTPVGTYQIADKQTNVRLTGSDSTGNWDDPVQYWLPFLTNQYGQYGFHDATWRQPGEFGNIDPNSSKASHGCVETPLATAKWLYGWAQIGTTVTVEN
jgi:L,D-transpeptidase catalytic domain